MTAPFVARTKQDRLKLQDDRPQLGQDGKPVLLTCGCRLMREPDVVVGKTYRYWCCGMWRTVKR